MVKVECWDLGKVWDMVMCNTFSSKPRKGGWAERAAQDNPKTWADPCQGCPLLVSWAFSHSHLDDHLMGRRGGLGEYRGDFLLIGLSVQCNSVHRCESRKGKKTPTNVHKYERGIYWLGNDTWNRSFKSAGRKVWWQIQLSTELGSLARFWIVFSGDTGKQLSTVGRPVSIRLRKKCFKGGEGMAQASQGGYGLPIPVNV